jgi:hypothetical protein
MIKTLEDVERYSQEQARLSAEIADHIELRRPGLSEIEAAALRRQLPGLPDDYLEIAQTWQLDGISIGFFNLWPGRGAHSGLATKLIGANGMGNPGFDGLRHLQMLWVATFEGDPVCVGRKQAAKAGQVFWLPSHLASAQPRFLACNFGDLLKAATELHAFSLSGRGVDGVPALISAIGAYIPEFGHAEWRDLASMVV